VTGLYLLLGVDGFMDLCARRLVGVVEGLQRSGWDGNRGAGPGVM